MSRGPAVEKLLRLMAEHVAAMPGSEVLSLTSPWELMRYRVPEGFFEGQPASEGHQLTGSWLYGIVYRNAKWRLSMTGHAKEVYWAVREEHPELSSIKVKRL